VPLLEHGLFDEIRSFTTVNVIGGSVAAICTAECRSNGPHTIMNVMANRIYVGRYLCIQLYILESDNVTSLKVERYDKTAS